VFALCQHHKWQVSEVENLPPYERDIYVALLTEYLDKLREEQEARRRK